jgi:CRP-like cAMP-binding protein
MQISMNRVEFFNQGEQLPEESNYLWLIINGVVKSYTVSTERKRVILGFWGKQEVVGTCLSNIQPYFIECINNVQAIAIPTLQWHTLSGNLLNRVQQTQQLSYIVRNPQTNNRLWLFLKWLSIKFGSETSAGRLINFKLTPQELAEALGMERIAVNKILNQFKQEGLILQLENRQIVLKQ